jgi:hypothetical protein
MDSALLVAAVVFAWLWHITPSDSTYETVEMETVSTRRVFLLLAIACVFTWLFVRFYL